MFRVASPADSAANRSQREATVARHAAGGDHSRYVSVSFKPAPSLTSDTVVMDLRVDIVTLGVPDLTSAHEFYVDRLGWEPAFTVPGEVTFLRAGPGRMVALFPKSDLEQDIGDGGATPLFDLGMLCEAPAAVDAAVDAMGAAGASACKPPQQADWGGYHAYVEAPDGTVWELAHNPGWRIDIDGTAHIRPIDSQ